MILTNIDITIKGDQSWEWQEQEWHEDYISTFKYQFTSWLNKCNVHSVRVVAINITYLPELRKFRIDEIHRQKEPILQALADDSKFKNKYFIL